MGAFANLRIFRPPVLVAMFVAAPPQSLYAGTPQTVTFGEYTPLSSNVELARRLLTPFESAELPSLVARTGKQLSVQPVDLAQESFVVYVPEQKPPAGYGLIVFVPPWDEARVPPEWIDTLDERGFIFVSAAKSGNDENPIGRREPLALLAEFNVAKRYPIDPARVYVAGFSGGSRIAMRLALGYPDIFRGAILNSGSDPIGNEIVPLPPKDLFEQFRDRTRLVYLTGDLDPYVRQADVASVHAMHDWCVAHVEARSMSGTGHALASASWFARALDLLAAPDEGDSESLTSCRAGIDADLKAKLDEAEKQVEAREGESARTLLEEIDRHFGGLAAPESLELKRRLGS